MSTTTWPVDYEIVLRAHLPFLAEDRTMTPDVDLVDCGLDSLATVSLLLKLEETFAVMIPDEVLTATTFRTAGSLWVVLAELVGDR